MELIDNGTVILIPSALEAGLGDPLFWGSIAAGFAIAYPFAFWANRYLIARGRGHAVMHEHHGPLTTDFRAGYSRENGGYLSVTRMNAYATTRRAQRCTPITKSNSERG